MVVEKGEWIMGAQKSNEEDELDIVVDISRERRGRGVVPVVVRGGGARKVEAMEETEDSEVSQQRRSRSSSSSGATAETSEGTEGVRREDEEEDEEMEEMEEEIDQAEVRKLAAEKKKGSGEGILKLKLHHGKAGGEGAEARRDKNGSVRGDRIPISAREESESPVQEKSRKRKKTIHFKNSRVPHAVPTLESESEEESGSPDRNEGSEGMRVRHAPGPRSAASKV